MKLLLDEVMSSKVAGNTVAVSFAALTGAPAIVSGYPASNLYDGTSAAYRLYRECRVSQVPADVWVLKWDLGAARTVDRCLLAGLSDSLWDGWAASPSGSIGTVLLQSSTDDAAWTTRDTVAAATSERFGTLSGPALWLDGGSTSARYWRVHITATGTGTVSIGFASLYREVAAIDASRLSWQVVPSAVQRTTERGNSRVLPGVERRILSAAALAQSAAYSIFDLLSRYAYRPGAGSALLDPYAVPSIALYPDDIGVATAEARCKAQRLPAMVTVEPSGWSVEATYGQGWVPNISWTLAEWV